MHRLEGKVKNVTVFRVADEWLVSIQVEHG
jgi:hypothetical protein